MTPVTIAGCPNTPVNSNRKMTLTKLIAAIDMLKMFVFLSIQGRMTLTAMSAPASTITRPMACTTAVLWQKATKTDLTRIYPSNGRTK